jgi:arginine/ornithine N-succinyltransferase beta subunit
MQNEILAEIKELRTALTQVLGISDLPPDQQFLKEALNKAAKEFQKLNIERGQWVADHSV